MPYTPILPGSATPIVASLGTPNTSVGDTLSSLRAQLKRAMGNRQDLQDSEYNAWLNQGYRYLAGMLPSSQFIASITFNTVAGQSQYLLPSNVSWVRQASVVDTATYVQGGRRLEKIDDQLYRNLDDADGEPELFFRMGQVIVFWPAPTNARAVSLDVKFEPQDLANETDSPILPVAMHRAIMLFARHFGFSDTEQFGKAAQAMNEAVAVVRPLLNTDAEERGNAHGRLQPVRTAAEMYRRKR